MCSQGRAVGALVCPGSTPGPCSRLAASAPSADPCEENTVLSEAGVSAETLLTLSRGSQAAVASSRVCQLAQAKRRRVQAGASCRLKPPPKTNLLPKASAHVELLAVPKQNHPKWEGARSVCWPISRAARGYVATQRLVELSCPKTRAAVFQGYDPYLVSRAALSASPTPRVQELSLPLVRKCISRE